MGSNDFHSAAFDDGIVSYPGKLRIPKYPGLSRDERNVEMRFALQIDDGCSWYMRKYREIWTTILNTDNAREFSVDYSASKQSRARYGQAVHEPSGALIKEMWKELLDESDPNDRVIFLAGGGGSGKTSMFLTLNDLEDLRGDTRRSIIYDTTLASFESSVAKINRALEHHQIVIVLYVHRPLALAVHGMLQRARTTGRVVPAQVLAHDHCAARDTILKLYRTYERNENVAILFIDNSGAKGDGQIADVDTISGYFTSGYSVESMKKIIVEIVENEYERTKEAKKSSHSISLKPSSETDAMREARRIASIALANLKRNVQAEEKECQHSRKVAVQRATR